MVHTNGGKWRLTTNVKIKKKENVCLDVIYNVVEKLVYTLLEGFYTGTSTIVY